MPAPTRPTRDPCRGWRDGTGRITGQKLWCSGGAARNTVIAMLVRTDPEAAKHKGLTVLLVPNDTPGLDIRRLPTLARRATGTTEIFVDGAGGPGRQPARRGGPGLGDHHRPPGARTDRGVGATSAMRSRR